MQIREQQHLAPRRRASALGPAAPLLDLHGHRLAGAAPDISFARSQSPGGTDADPRP